MHTATITHCVTVGKGDHIYFPNFPPFQGVVDIELGQDDENEVASRMRKFAIAGGHSFIACVAWTVEVIVEELWDISVGVLGAGTSHRCSGDMRDGYSYGALSLSESVDVGRCQARVWFMESLRMMFRLLVNKFVGPGDAFAALNMVGIFQFRLKQNSINAYAVN